MLKNMFNQSKQINNISCRHDYSVDSLIANSLGLDNTNTTNPFALEQGEYQTT